MEELFNIEKVLGFCEKVCYFFTVNLLFMISNTPVLLFLLFVGAGQIRECLPLFLVCLLPMAPSLSAVMYAMNRLIRGMEGKALRDYKKGYTRDFLRKAGLGADQLMFILMCWTNIEFFAVQFRILPLAILVLCQEKVQVKSELFLQPSIFYPANLSILFNFCSYTFSYSFGDRYPQ